MTETLKRQAHKARGQARERRAKRPRGQWYWSRRWRIHRDRQLYRQPWCAMCAQRGLQSVATVADHIVPHRFDYHAFWHGELQSLCKRCHDSLKQADEARGYSMAVSEEGWPTDERHPFNRKAAGLPRPPPGRTRGRPRT